MIDNILRTLLTLTNKLLVNFSALISVLLSFFLSNYLNIAKYITIFDEHELELNIVLYTAIFSKIISLLEGYINNNKVEIECYFYENKDDLEKEKVLNILEIKTSEYSNNLYLDVKYCGNYRALKRYYLEISFPTWVDLNQFSRTSLFTLEEREIDKDLSTSHIIIDFVKLYNEDCNHKDASRNTKLHFLINDIEEMGCTELIEISIKSNKKLSLYKFNSNKLRISKEL